MKHLWDKNENDPEYVMSNRLTKTPCFYTKLDDDRVEELIEVHHALVQVYYDVFNNGGGNLYDVGWLQDAIEKITEYAKSKDIDVPVFVEMLEDESGLPGDSFESIDCDPMDEFARKCIRCLYLDLTDAL